MKTIHFLIIFFLAQWVYGQDIHFSQYYDAPMQINPAFAMAFSEDFNTRLLYRDQWRNVSYPYQTIYGSVEIGIIKNKKKNGLGMGISFWNDKAGSTKMQQSVGSLSMATGVGLGANNSLYAGLQGTIKNRNMETKNLQWGNQYNGNAFDPGLPSHENELLTNLTHSDFAIGFLWNNRAGKEFNMNFGTSIYHLSKPNESFYTYGKSRVYEKVVVYFDMNTFIYNTDNIMIPKLYYTKQGPSEEWNLGITLRFGMEKPDEKINETIPPSAFNLGVLYRIGDAMIFIFGFDIKKKITIGFAYDTNVSQLKAASRSYAGVEFSLVYHGFWGKK